MTRMTHQDMRLLDFENAILDLFEMNRITIQDAKIVLWTLLTAIYEDELIEERHRREVIENIPGFLLSCLFLH